METQSGQLPELLGDRARTFARYARALTFHCLLAVVATGANAGEFSVLHTIDVRWDQDGDHFTPIVTDDADNLYFAFVNTDDKIVVGKKPPDRRAETVTVTPLMGQADRYHSTPSIALDANGFIHVFGPMHNSNMDYLRSNLPHEVSAGFSRRDAGADGLWLGVVQAGHHWITYPYVFYDNDLNPWVAYRSRAGTTGWSPGTQCAQLARFNSDSRRWEPRGGNSNADFGPVPGAPEPRPRCFAWSTYSQDGVNGYQAWNVKPFIDGAGRLHYPIRHVRSTGSTSWGQDLFYLYSDDGGHNWATADRIRVEADPLSISALDSRRSVWWAVGPTGNNDIYGAHAGSSRGRPVVGYQLRTESTGEAGTTRFAIYENAAWTRHDTGLNAFPGRLLVDTNDVWIMLGGDRVHVSHDSGRTWLDYDPEVPMNGQNANFDVRHFKRTNHVRFVASPTVSSGSKTISIVEFRHDGPLPRPTTKAVTGSGN